MKKSLRIILFCSLMVFVMSGVANSEIHSQEPLKVGSTTNLGVLPLIAKNENIFSEKRLVVEYKKFQTGKMTMDDLISGDIEAETIVDSNVALKPFHFSVQIGSSALPLVKSIGEWISVSQEDFKGKSAPSYEQSFHDQIKANGSGNFKKVEHSVTFCRPNNMVSALVYIAEANGYFKEQGLNARFEKTTNAKICQDVLLANNADYMTGAEGPFTYLAASNPPIKILAMLQQNPETSVFARRDRNITKFEDLKGKRVAYLPGTVSYFFLGRVMKKYGIGRFDLQLTSMQPPTMPAALVGGSIDAFSMWEPWGTQASTQSPENIINLTETDLYQYEALLSGREEAIKSNPEIPTKILHALIKAEQFINQNDDEAFAILSNAIAFEPNAFKKLWKQYRHKVRVDDHPIKLMEENFTLLKEDDANFKDAPIPNFRSFVDASFLKAIDQNRVKLNE